MSRALTVLLLTLCACGGGPDPCDTLCEEAGFGQVEVFAEGGSEMCACSDPGGFGSLLTLEDCQGYCKDVGGEASLESTESDDDTCVCTP